MPVIKLGGTERVWLKRNGRIVLLDYTDHNKAISCLTGQETLSEVFIDYIRHRLFVDAYKASLLRDKFRLSSDDARVLSLFLQAMHQKVYERKSRAAISWANWLRMSKVLVSEHEYLQINRKRFVYEKAIVQALRRLAPGLSVWVVWTQSDNVPLINRRRNSITVMLPSQLLRGPVLFKVENGVLYTSDGAYEIYIPQEREVARWKRKQNEQSKRAQRRVSCRGF